MIFTLTKINFKKKENTKETQEKIKTKMGRLDESIGVFLPSLFYICVTKIKYIQYCPLKMADWCFLFHFIV